MNESEDDKNLSNVLGKVDDSETIADKEPASPVKNEVKPNATIEMVDNEMKETPLELVLAEDDPILVDPVYHTAGVIPRENKFYTFVNHVSSLKGLSSFNLIMDYSDSIIKVRGIMARIIRASRCRDKRSIYE